MAYRIGSFNCLNFGLGVEKDVKLIAEIIHKEKFDIIALQEIKGKAALNRILSELRRYSFHWVGVADDGYVNDYAFIWNKRRVDIVKTTVNGKERSFTPHIYKQYKIDRKAGQTDIVREPFYARFEPNEPGVPKFEMRILNTHIRYSKSKNNKEDLLLPGEIAMRRNEFDVLTKAIYTRVADKQYGSQDGGNRVAYTILLGDYNLNLPNSRASSPYLVEEITIQEPQRTRRIVTTQKELTTLKKPTKEPQNPLLPQQIYVSNYDHFTYDQNRFSGISAQCGRIDTVNNYCNGDYEEHIKKVSDHVPVVLDIDFRGG